MLAVENGEPLDRPDPARRPVRAWRTVDGEHLVTLGRLRGHWYVEHRARSWRAHLFHDPRHAEITADLVRASIPGHAWIELEPTRGE